MKRVLVIGPSFFYYNDSISNAFQQLGYTTKVIQYDEPINPFNWRNALLHKVLPNKEGLRAKSRAQFNQYICGEFDTFSPDIVFIYNGDILEKDTINYFKQRAKVAIWLLDGIYRHPRSEALANMADSFFCFEQADVDYLKKKGIESYFLPQACDTSIYHPLPSEKDIDILFIGALYGYPKRIKLLKEVASRFKNYNVQIYGVYKPIYKNPIKWLFRENRSVFKNRNVSPAEVNLLYNKARICLNIHHEQSTNGANPKVFEISGAKAFQLVDWNPYIESLFPNKEVGLYHSEEEMLLMIDHYLSVNTDKQVTDAYTNVVEKHTFVNRIQEALTYLT